MFVNGAELAKQSQRRRAVVTVTYVHTYDKLQQLTAHAQLIVVVCRMYVRMYVCTVHDRVMYVVMFYPILPT